MDARLSVRRPAPLLKPLQRGASDRGVAAAKTGARAHDRRAHLDRGSRATFLLPGRPLPGGRQTHNGSSRFQNEESPLFSSHLPQALQGPSTTRTPEQFWLVVYTRGALLHINMVDLHFFLF